LVEALEPGEGVEKVLPIMAPYKRASSELKAERTVVKARGLEVGGVRVAVIAGPARSRARRRSSGSPDAQGGWGLAACAAGRTSRGPALQLPGHKEEGLKMLPRRAGRPGLAIVTEVMAPEHVPVVAAYADVLQIGARNMQNYQLLQAVGDSGKPTMLKRGMSADDRRVPAGRRVYPGPGQPHVMLCERGVRTFEDHTRFTLPLATVPYLHDEEPPAGGGRPLARHGQGQARAPMARAAVAAGADA
jgi:3-deoxy-7-phosphoheptulonate synthase